MDWAISGATSKGSSRSLDADIRDMHIDEFGDQVIVPSFELRVGDGDGADGNEDLRNTHFEVCVCLCVCVCVCVCEVYRTSVEGCIDFIYRLKE